MSDKTTVTAFTPNRADIRKHRKEDRFKFSHSLIDLDTGNEVVTVRFYETTQTIYCVVWFQTERTHYARGSDKAGGYGYHMASSALEGALSNAGITLSKDIAGGGDTAMQDAYNALAEYFGLARSMVIYAHA